MKWKDIPGYEGLYKVSDTGLVKSEDRIVKGRAGCERLRRGRILRQTCHIPSGSPMVGLCLDGVRKAHYVSRLVAEAFVSKTGHETYVTHKDGNVKNNRADNLEWVTPEEVHGHLTKRDVEQIRSLYVEFDSSRGRNGLAKRFGVSVNTISRILKRETWRMQ